MHLLPVLIPLIAAFAGISARSSAVAEANLAEVDEGSIYTYGKPAAGSLLSAFIGYVRTDAAASVLLNVEDTPCDLMSLCG